MAESSRAGSGKISTQQPPSPALPQLRGLQIFALIFTSIFVLHLPLLRLPYFWDEAGYYIPAAYDFLRDHQLIPHSTLSNAHPPLPNIYLAMWWQLSAFRPSVTRIAMLLVAAFALTAVFRLARLLTNVPVAIATVLLTAMFPVWFAQSSLAHADVMAAAFTLWGLVYYFEAKRPTERTRKRWMAVLLFSLAALAKETAIITPLALAAFDVFLALRNRADRQFLRRELGGASLLLLTTAPLALWFVYHRVHTGYFFGNPEYFRYNVGSTINPLRILLTLVRRLWQLFGYMGMILLTLLMLYAMSLPPLRDERGDRPRIALSAQYRMAIVFLAQALLFSFLGGAVLARYQLPAYPLVILIFVSTLWRRLWWWKWAIAAVLAVYVVFLFNNPISASPPEDNLQYRDFVLMHKRAASYLEQHYAHARVLTAWPATDELTKPFLGYVTRPQNTVAVDNFALSNLLLAAQQPDRYDVVLVFSTKHRPRNEIRWQWWQRLSERFYDYHDDVPPQAAAQLLGGVVVWQQATRDQWVGIVDMQKSELARQFGHRVIW